MLIDEISKKVAEENGLPVHIVTQINRVQYKFLLETMQSGEMKGVSIMYLGKFVKNKRYSKTKTNVDNSKDPN